VSTASTLIFKIISGDGAYNFNAKTLRADPFAARAAPSPVIEIVPVLIV